MRSFHSRISRLNKRVNNILYHVEKFLTTLIYAFAKYYKFSFGTKNILIVTFLQIGKKITNNFRYHNF